jgi:hypothetical protein
MMSTLRSPQDQFISYLVDILEEVCEKRGFEFPITVVVIPADGSVLVSKCVLKDGEPDIEPVFNNAKTMVAPVNIMVVDAHGKGARGLIEKGQTTPTMVN